MNPTPDRIDAETEDDPRLVRAAQEYLAELESGRRPDRAEFTARFPDLAGQLAPYLDALDMVHGAGPMAARSPAKTAAEGLAAESLGDFHILHEIGRGGMGVVYEAVQLSLGRRVALKVLPFAAALDGRQLQRFKNEAQAAAQLHHTNIVPVYAVGCERGTHFYAMQLIEGQNLADLIGALRATEPDGAATGSYRPASSEVDFRRWDEIHRDDENRRDKPGGSPTSQAQAAELSTQHTTHSARFFRTAARIVVQAADALEHAHQFGVIHRDVKPANLIVDERGNVWVTDFGLAQFHTGQGLTRTGDLMGTLRYMSPEQAGGLHAVLDARADVYSLGATFYELLTLRPMFDGADAQRLLQQILHDEPRPPRAVDRSIPAELDTIVLKTVSKNPADRYATAREMADDLRRFLDNRPILARPPSLAQRLRKLARRHPSVVVSGLVLCVLTAVVSLVSAALIHQAYDQERMRAEQAEKGLKLARQSADEMIQISEQELAGKPFTDAARKRMLTSALVYYQGLIALSGDDPAAQADLASAREHVNKILSDLAVLQGGARLDLLHRDDVKEDLDANGLGVTVEQHAQLDDLEGRLRERLPPFFKLTLDERQQRLLDDARAKEDAFDTILTSQQQRRLGQIALQLKPWLSAFHDPEVATTLNLTASQKELLKTVEAEAFLAVADLRRGPGEPGKSAEPVFRAATEKFLAALTDEQRRLWKDMTGEPFKAASQPFGTHGPRPGPQPPGPPGQPPPQK